MNFKKDNLIVLVILGVFVLCAVFFVYVPQGRKIDKLRTQITTQSRHLAEESKKVAIVPDLQRQVNTMKSRYRNFDSRLPRRQELGGFLREISGHLANEKLSNQLIEPGKPCREELFHTLPIIMKFKGSYLALGAFLKQINQMERLTRVQKLSIRQGQDKKDELLEIELQLNIYFTES